MIQTFLQERADRLKNVTRNADLVQQYALLSVIRLQPELYRQLIADVQAYIAASLRAFNPQKHFEAGSRMLEDYEEEILKLPNRTPNGKLAAKEEISAEFNRVQVSMERIIADLNFASGFEFVQLPVIVRIQAGLMDAIVDNRSYATSKLHSDIWTGEPASSGTLIVPIMGDLENIGLEFNEPSIESYEEFVKTHADYKDTESLTRNLKKYDCSLESGNLYFFDSYCVHKTIKKKHGLRVSIDFRITFKDRLESDTKADVLRISNYCPREEWFTSQRNVKLIPNATVQQTLDALKNHTFSQGYDLRKEFRQVPLKDNNEENKA